MADTPIQYDPKNSAVCMYMVTRYENMDKTMLDIVRQSIPIMEYYKQASGASRPNFHMLQKDSETIVGSASDAFILQDMHLNIYNLQSMTTPRPLFPSFPFTRIYRSMNITLIIYDRCSRDPLFSLSIRA